MNCSTIIAIVFLFQTQSAPLPPSALHNAAQSGSSPADAYILGPEDSLNIKVLNADELGTLPYPIDLSGFVMLPRVGRIQAAGLTVEQLQTNLTKLFKEYLQEPIVTVSVAEFRSQPISVLGQVGTPGVHQIQGRKTLFEVISEAGGLKPEAGNTINITRRKENGPIPLPNAVSDPTGQFTVAVVKIRDLMDARNPQENIPVKPYDVITVPLADKIYVIGSVMKAGAFVLTERGDVSILQALSMAEGLEKTAASRKAKIIRGAYDGSGTPLEIPVDLKQILDGKAADVPLIANDILFVPNSAAKSAGYKTLDAIINAGTMAAVYRPL